MKMNKILKKISICFALIFLILNLELFTDPLYAKDVKSENISIIYDHNGNLLNDGQNLYTYDVKNQLIKITNQNTGEETTFTYGPLGNRVTTTLNNNTTYHLYNGVDEIQERTSDGSLLREYIPGFAIIDYTDVGSYPAGEAEVLYYLQDVLGSTVALADVFGNVVEQYYYEPYGDTVITNGEGTEQLSESAFGNLYMWTGQRYDSENALYHFYARSYSPYLGRFLQRDPLGYVDGMNLYEYVGSSPMNSVDPLGLQDAKFDIIGRREVKEILDGNYNKVKEERQARGFALYFSVLDTGIDTTEVVTGYDIITGEEIGWTGRGITLVAMGLPFVPGGPLRRLVKLIPIPTSWTNKASSFGDAIKNNGKASWIWVSENIFRKTPKAKIPMRFTSVSDDICVLTDKTGTNFIRIQGNWHAISSANRKIKTAEDAIHFAEKGSQITRGNKIGRLNSLVILHSRPRFRSAADAIGYGPVRQVGRTSPISVETEFFKAGFTQRMYFRTPDQIKHSVNFNPTTGEYLYTHPSSDPGDWLSLYWYLIDNPGFDL